MMRGVSLLSTIGQLHPEGQVLDSTEGEAVDEAGPLHRTEVVNDLAVVEATSDQAEVDSVVEVEVMVMDTVVVVGEMIK